MLRIDKDDIDFIWSDQKRRQAQYKRARQQNTSLDTVVETIVKESKAKRRRKQKRETASDSVVLDRVATIANERQGGSSSDTRGENQLGLDCDTNDVTVLDLDFSEGEVEG